MNCIESNGFLLDRVSGSHHIFVHSHIETPLNMQKKKDGTTKGYQVKQAIKIIDGDKFWGTHSIFFLIPKETEITLPKL